MKKMPAQATVHSVSDVLLPASCLLPDAAAITFFINCNMNVI